MAHRCVERWQRKSAFFAEPDKATSPGKVGHDDDDDDNGVGDMYHSVGGMN